MRHTRWWAAPAAMVSIALPCLSLAATFNVPADFASIQACIDAAVSGVDECVVAPGTYHETINFLGKAITLRSSLGADVTTIDATGIGGSVVTCASAEGPDTVLNGFTITGGAGTDLGKEIGFAGGGMFIDGSSPTVSDCVFAGNTATFGGGMHNNASNPTVSNCTFSGNTAYHGGGMRNYFSSPTVTTCTFSGNRATGAFASGGGMYNKNSSPTITKCTFSDNIAHYYGGGILNYHANTTVTDSAFNGNYAYDSSGGMSNYGGNPTVTNSTFSGNTAARDDGGGMFNEDSNATVTNCTFSGNTARFGGGMSNRYRSPTVIHCSFTGNTAGGGGGMYNRDSKPTVTQCTFTGNTATSGGGMENYDASPMVTVCAFAGNTSSYGGGMSNSGGNPTLTDCRFSGNAAKNDGGGMYNYSSSAMVTNCTLSGNAASNGGGMYNYTDSYQNRSPTLATCIAWGDSPNEIVHPNYPPPTIRFSDVQGGLPVGSIDGGGNIDLDPIFIRPPDPGPDGTWDGVDDDYGDLRLRGGSPCIDAGDPGFIALPGETDLEGHARVLCEYVDMGAYEFGIGDYDCDQTVYLTDFANWSACMTGPLVSHVTTLPGQAPPRSHEGTIQNRQSTIDCEVFDFDGDDDVDILDFAAFQLVFNVP